MELAGLVGLVAPANAAGGDGVMEVGDAVDAEVGESDGEARDAIRQARASWWRTPLDSPPLASPPLASPPLESLPLERPPLVSTPPVYPPLENPALENPPLESPPFGGVLESRSRASSGLGGPLCFPLPTPLTAWFAGLRGLKSVRATVHVSGVGVTCVRWGSTGTASGRGVL